MTVDSGAAAAQAAGVLAPEAGMLDPDPVLLGRAIRQVAMAEALHPQDSLRPWLTASAGVVRAGMGAFVKAFGPPSDSKPGGAAKARDKRFADPTWEDNPAFFAMRELYETWCTLCDDLVEAARVDERTRRKALLAVRLIESSLAPTNFLPTNPAALKRAFETGGRSVLAGMRNMVDDMLTNGGRPRQVDASPFELGRNMAATPAKVVYRNDLMELLQYDAQTEQVHEVPILASPPWINKYYVMDLAPGRSFIEWAVRHGHTVFAISYRNPDASMAETSMDDYLIYGPRTALDVVGDITGADKVNIVGLCLGGALTAMTSAYLEAVGDERIGCMTLLNTLLDYSDPGILGCFTDEESVSRLEKRMERTGYLEGSSMATTFDLLRADDLIFNYVASNWLMGEQPPAFDILAWNADSTRMPRQMHTFYLRSLYRENRFATGTLELAGQRLSLDTVKEDVYLVAAVNDHIVPWASSYRSTQLLGGDVHYVLSSGGHIAGIVNPPSPKAWYLTNDDSPREADRWRSAATRHAGSWWEDWAAWIGERAGALREPPPTGNRQHPVLGDGPGSYVRG